MKMITMIVKNKNLSKEDKSVVVDMTCKALVPYVEKPKKPVKPPLRERFKSAKEKIKDEMHKSMLIKNLNNRWLDVMYHLGFMNNYKQTFTLKNIVVTTYGFCGEVIVPDGYSIYHLEDKTKVIQNNLKCTFVLDKIANSNISKIKFIKIENCNSIPFVPAEVEPFEAYFGVDESGDPIIFDVNIEPQILIAGQTRMGKNGSIDHAITSWIHSCTEDEIGIYLFQFAKGDMGKYKRCRQIKCFSMSNLPEMVRILTGIMTEMKRRTLLLMDMLESFKGDNLYDYNKLHPNEKLPYIYIIIDEFMDIANTKQGDSNAKEIIISYLQSIAEFGGALGINYIILHQKPSKDLCPTFLKNQSNIRISYGFKDEVCSQIVLGESNRDKAVGLPPRKAYYISNTRHGYMYTTNLRNSNGHSRILRYIKSSFIYNKKKVIASETTTQEKNTQTRPEDNQNLNQSKEKPSKNQELLSVIQKLKQQNKNIQPKQEENE